MSIFSGVNAREKLMGSIHRDSSSEPKRQGVYIGKSTGVIFSHVFLQLLPYKRISVVQAIQIPRAVFYGLF